MSEKEVASKYAKGKLFNLHKEIEFLQNKLAITESLCQNKSEKVWMGIRSRIQELIDICVFLEKGALIQIGTAKQFQLENLEKVRRTLENFSMRLNTASYGELSQLQSEWNKIHDVLSLELKNCGILELKENSSQIFRHIQMLSSVQLLRTISPMSIPANVIDNSNTTGVSGDAIIHTVTPNYSTRRETTQNTNNESDAIFDQKPPM